jgi:hypothetical protein
MNDHSTGRAPACCKAGPSLNLGFTPQGGSPTEPTAMKKIERRNIISYATVMKIGKKMFGIYVLLYIVFSWLKWRSEQAFLFV